MAMPISPAVLKAVRERAGHACEYCGVTEADAGGQLTLDHYQPRSAGGTDDPDNLVYCCPNCNTFKAAYWPEQPADVSLWNPRTQPREDHILPLADGRLLAVSAAGRVTIDQLRLNRSELVEHRHRRISEAALVRFLGSPDGLIASLRLLGQQNQDTQELLRLILQTDRAILRIITRLGGSE